MLGMEWLSETFFESPTLVYAALIFLEAGLLARWLVRRGRRAALWMLLPIALGLGVFALERAVVTDREQILRSTDRLAASVREGRAHEELERVLSKSAQFSAGLGQPDLLDRRTVIDLVEQRADSYRVREVRIHRPAVEIHDGRATMNVVTIIHYGDNGRDSLIWDLEWVKEEDGRWRIVTIHPPQRGLKL